MDESRYFIRRTPAITVQEVETEARELFEQDEPIVDLRRYWRIVWRHRRVVVGITAAAIILTAVHLMSAKPIYTAETTILIQPNAEQGSDTLASLVEIEAAAANADQYYKTQCAILQSHNLAGLVVNDLGLDHNALFLGKGDEDSLIERWWPGNRTRQTPPAESGANGGAPEELTTGTAETPEAAAAVHQYLKMLKVSPVPDTNLVKISFATPDARLSAKLANAHVVAYEREQAQMRGDQNEAAQRFLRDKLGEIKEQLQKSEIALNDYRREKGIIPGLMSLDGKDAVVLDRLADLSKDLTQAQVARIALESQVQLINKHYYSSLPEVTRDLTITDLEKQLNELYGQAAALSSQFKPDYPPLAKLQAQIGEVEARLNAATAKVVGGIQMQYREAVAKENELQAEMNRSRSETLNLNDAAAQYAILQREVDTNRELYNAVLTRIKDVAIASGAEHTNVAVINSAEVPGAPTSPRKDRDLMLALIAGLAGGIGLAFALDSMDNTLKNPEEAENYLRLPSLGFVPEFAGLNGRAVSYRPRGLIADGAADAMPARELVTAHGSYSPLGEAYRNLRTALLLSRAGTPPKTILITSATSREGKTVTAVNIAVMLAQAGGRTLLIDADLRRARCHRVLAIDNPAGLTEVLTGARGTEETARATAIEHLDFLGAGSAPPNPTELLGSGKMADVLNGLEEHYHFIVIDSSPVLPVSDALLLAQLVDGVIVIANSRVTPKQQVKAACARLEYARGKILGVVLNRVRLESPDFQYYYHSDYHSERAADG
jgi:capsular exopolysaccharide synthesis family protein